MIKWRNLYLSPSNLLLDILREHHIKHLIDDFGNTLIMASEDVKWVILDSFYSKKGVVLKDHGISRVTA